MSEYTFDDIFTWPANEVLEEKKEPKKEEENTIKICTWHNWILYRGFIDSFEYCKECGIKREGML